MDSKDQRDKMVMLLGNIADMLGATEFSALQHFAYDYLHDSELESCEKELNPSFHLLLQMFHRLDECDKMIDWLKDVFYHLDQNSILIQIVKYEVEKNQVTKPFTVMLNNVSQQMSEKDFGNLKSYFTALVPNSYLDRAHNAFNLFRILQQHQLLNEKMLDKFKEKLSQLTNKRMLHIVEQYEEHIHKTWKANKPHSRKTTAERIQTRPPNVKQVEQIYQVRQTGPRFSHPSVSNNKSNFPLQCTEHPTTSSLHYGTHQQQTGSSDLGNNCISGMILDEPVRNPSEIDSRMSESNTASVAAQPEDSIQKIGIVAPIRASQTRQEDPDQTKPKAFLGEVASETVRSQTQAMPELNLAVENEQTESFSMDPKDVDESTEVKCIANNGDSMIKLKLAVSSNMLQQAACYITEQHQNLLRNNSTEQCGLVFSVSSMDDEQLIATSSQNCTDDDKKGLMPNKGHKDETAQVKKTSSPFHMDSPSMISSSNLQNTGLIPPITMKNQHVSTADDREVVDSLIPGIRNVLKKPHPSIKLYNYQKELAARAIDGHNCIICAPTGSGKALTAAYVCYVKRQLASVEKRPFKALYIVCMRNLIKERKEELLKVFTSEESCSEIVSSMSESAKLSGMLQRHDIVVLTAQVLVNALKSKEVDLKNIQLLILDECHHTNFGHPYNIIMQEYHRLKMENCLLPQIVGLTTSLGSGEKGDPIEHYIVMCANLHCTRITYVHEYLDELLEHNPRPEKDQIISVLPRDPNDIFILTISYLMTETEKLTPQITTGIPPRGSQKYENWIVSIRKEAERMHLEDNVFTCQTLFVYNTALIYCDELATVDVLPLLTQHFNSVNRNSRMSEIRRKVFDLYNSQVKELEEVVAAETLDDNEKLKKLHDLLLDLYDTNPDAKGVLLTRTRFGVDGLVSFIKRHNRILGLVKCAKLVGQGRGEGLMSDRDQQEILSRFRLNSTEKDHINLLIATNVAQEGLDLPRCNFVIRYNFVPSEIGLVQSRSLATAKNSECYLIVNKGSVNEIREYENLAKEHAMMEALEEIHQIKEEDLMQKIAEQQEKMWRKKEAEEERKSYLEYICDIKDIVIYCKSCQQPLCSGTDLRKRGPQFVANSAALEGKVRLSKSPKPAEFRYETHIGSVYCKDRSCNQRLGLHIKYNYGTPYGYALSRNSVVWGRSCSSDYNTIKQWSKVPFSIMEEPVEPQ